MSIKLKSGICAGLLLTLCACGGGGYGGGGGGGGSGGYGGGGGGNLSSAPGEAAVNAYVQASHQSSLTASNSGNTYTLQLSSVANASPTTFNGSTPAYSTVDTLTVNKNGAQVAHSVSTSYFLLNPLVPLGKVSSTGTPYAIVTSSMPLPMTVTVGNSGIAFYNLTYYHDSTKSMVDASATATYSVTANNATTLLLCFNAVVSGVTAQGTTDGLANGTETDCYTVDAVGSATLTSIALAVSGTMLTFK